MFVSFIHVYARTKEELIKVLVKYLKMLPYLKCDGTVSPCGSFPFLAVVHRVCGTLHESSLMSYVFLVQIVKLHVSLSSSPIRVYLRTSQVDIESFPAGFSPTKYPISTIAYYRLKNQPRHQSLI